MILSSPSINQVRSTMRVMKRALSGSPRAVTCAACGRRILASDDVVKIHSSTFHTECAPHPGQTTTTFLHPA